MSDAAGLSPRQRAVLTIIRSGIATSGSPPTMRALAAALGCSLSSAFTSVDRLVQRGHLRRTRPGCKQSLELTSPTYDVLLDAGTERRLLRFAVALGRPPETLIAEAVRAFLAAQETHHG